MTNYNERLDEILKDIIHIGYVSGYNQVAHEARISPYNHIEPLTIAEAKQAITSLIKELVAEARIDELNRLMEYTDENEIVCVCEQASVQVCDHNWSLCHKARGRIAELRQKVGRDDQPE